MKPHVVVFFFIFMFIFIIIITTTINSTALGGPQLLQEFQTF
jgi:hypothetical protein